LGQWAGDQYGQQWRGAKDESGKTRNPSPKGHVRRTLGPNANAQIGKYLSGFWVSFDASKPRSSTMHKAIDFCSTSLHRYYQVPTICISYERDGVEKRVQKWQVFASAGTSHSLLQRGSHAAPRTISTGAGVSELDSASVAFALDVNARVISLWERACESEGTRTRAR
jgi:hypothetical protein